MQVLQGMSSGNQLAPSQNGVAQRSSSMFGDLSANNGWGNFDFSKTPQNNTIGNLATQRDNPFSLLGDALTKRGGLNGAMGNFGYNQNMPNSMIGMGGGLEMAGYHSISQPQMNYSPYYPSPIYR